MKLTFIDETTKYENNESFDESKLPICNDEVASLLPRNEKF